MTSSRRSGRPRPARGAVVFVHPTTTGLGLPGLDGHYLWNSVGNPLETSIAAAQLVAGGVLERCPSLIVLLAHGGGALLSLRGRLRHAHAVRPEARSGGAADTDEMLRPAVLRQPHARPRRAG